MGGFRVLHISIVVLVLFGSTWLVRVVGMAAEPSGSSSTWLTGNDALAGVLRQADNDNGDADNDGDNDDGDNDDADNNDEDNDNGDDDNDDGDDNENVDDFELPPLPSASGPDRKPEPVCTTPGQDTVFTSQDGKATVRVFSTTPRPVRIEIDRVTDFLSAPLPPGTLVGLLAYEIRGSNCDASPLTQLPAEANLGIRYDDFEAIGLDESRFVIGRLDVASGTWAPVEKRATDPAANLTSATIIQTGRYMVWETR
jgi:hypothetical protein